MDILTCAAPNLRAMPNNAMNPGNDKAMSLTDELGAFGCGAFQNKPEIVAQAYKEVLTQFDGYFQLIEFAVYCIPRDESNYLKFKKAFESYHED